MAIPANWTDLRSLDGQRLAALASSRLPPVLTLVLVAVLGWQLAGIAWMLVPGAETGDAVTVEPPAGAVGSAQQADGVDVERIAAAHLFGEADAEGETAPVPVAPTENLQETRLALTLKGTMAGSDNRWTVAIIADNRNEEKIYTIGDSVASATTLHSVYPDQVVLNRSGVLESLKLPKDLPTTSASTRSMQTNTRMTTTSSPEVQSIQTALTQNAAQLSEVIRPTPYYVAGQQQGFKVYPGRDRRQFAALGLRPGDLIMDIDGQALTDPQQAMQIFQNLGTADQVSVTIERNGQQEVLMLTTSQLMQGDESESDSDTDE